MTRKNPRPIPTLCCAFAAVLVALAPLGCASRPRVASTEQLLREEGRRINEAMSAMSAAEEAENDDQPDAALAHYRRAIQLYAEFPAAWNNMGVVLMERQRYMEANDCFRTAADLAPRDPRPAYNLGLTWDRSGYTADALSYYLSALDRDPRYLPALRGALRAERRLDVGTEETLDRFRRALMLEQDPRLREWLSFNRLRLETELAAAAPDMAY